MPTFKMPFGDPPDYIHLHPNESQMQLISIGDSSETSGDLPCFNNLSREEPPVVVFIPGKLFEKYLCINGD
ncbi:hypothetical protein DICVIV_01205 [Dictyocaulus viviparus]|uniref:Uncharacterized protein n=1 Tax=Dictyocaulus viviparus TaxID=29172 RepID=A0A0D8Y7A7_DICVI|nr:hypothetical protein DICVIV_01205 [Dictyocaulus viviparus]